MAQSPFVSAPATLQSFSVRPHAQGDGKRRATEIIRGRVCRSTLIRGLAQGRTYELFHLGQKLAVMMAVDAALAEDLMVEQCLPAERFFLGPGHEATMRMTEDVADIHAAVG